MTDRRVALIADAGFYVGPALSRLLAERGHDLVLGDPDPGLVDELTAAGTDVEVVTGARDLSQPDAGDRLVAAAQERFGRLDAACAFSGMIVIGRFLESSVEDLHTVLNGCVEAP
jgi:3-oxoacyl-[acyl-carrier protein] reductase